MSSKGSIELSKLFKLSEYALCNPQTCQPWDQFIDASLWSDTRTQGRIRTYWATYMPKCFVISHNRHIISLACTPA